MSETKSAYKRAGVDLAASDQTLGLIKAAVKRTYTPNVLAGLGAFGGLFDVGDLKQLDSPVLVASTDGVGTKTKVAAALGQTYKLGFDIVHHCVNDILVQGAKPLFFLDYVAAARLEPPLIADLIAGIAEACGALGIPLLGGETAEMPGVYAEGEFDLVGTIIGLVDRGRIVDGSQIQPGDKLLALMSGGLQTNGFSLARRALEGKLHDSFGGSTVGETLLTPHRSYLETVAPLLERNLIRGMAHITGGGLPGNLPRILPDGLGARVERGSWDVPEIFRLIQRAGEVSEAEMFEVFNMGVGFVLVASPEEAEEVQHVAEESLYPVGEVVEGDSVQFV